MGNIKEVSNQLKEYIATKEGVKAQYTVTETETREITMENGAFSLFRTLYDNKVRVKLIHNQRIGDTSTNCFDQQALEKVVDDAILAAESSMEDEFYDIAPGMEPAEFHKGVEEPDIDKLMMRAKELSEDIAREYPNIMLMQLMFKYVKEHSFYQNTNGSQDEMTSGYYLIALEYSGNDGKQSSGLAGGYVVVDNLEKPFIEVGAIRKNLADAEASIYPQPVEGKFEGSVILTPEGVQEMFSFALGVLADDEVLLSQESKWLGKIGEKVASDKLTLGLCPNDPRIIGTEVRTDDGFRAEDYSIIEKGVLKSYMASLYVSNKCKVERAKNSGLDMVITSGDVPVEDMIKSMDKGLIIGAISCGYPSANCEVSGVAKNSFYVENGQVKHAVAETMVSFNLHDMFQNIEEISKEVVLDGALVLPYIKVGKVTVSGK